MAPPARDLASDLRQHHGVETPEHVDVRFELAGVGSRLAAALLDMILIWLIGICIRVVFGFVIDLDVPALSQWVTALLVLLSFILSWGYFVLFEALNGGRTPGKQALGIRVVMDTGRPVTFGAAVIRNLTKPWAILLAPLLVGMVSMFIDRSNKRLGDMAAGTIVVRDHPTVWSIGAAPVAAELAEPIETGPPDLTEEEFRLLDRFLSRVNELAPEVRNRIAANLAQRFEGRIPRRTQDTQTYLAEVFNSEQGKRRSRFAVRAQPGAAGRTTVTGERFLARKREAWEAFRKVALRMEGSGVGALAPREIPGFAAQYREVAADLARARTYQVDPRVIEYLERVVAAGHNALYRARGKARTPLHWYLLRDFPAAVVQSTPYVLVAFLLFAIPAAAGYAILRERPSLAEEVMPGVMISRAEQAAERQAQGRGYAQQGENERPRVAAMIITNNIQVSFLAFVGGLTGGLLTVWVLAFNGAMLGFSFALFKNYGALGYLTTFVAGHGILELTAIFISAGAGLRLAKALIAPGDRTRKDAMVMEGRIAVRMIGAVVTLLAIAGAIEGLLSTSDAPAVVKYGVSAATAVLLVLYLANGYRELRARSP